MRPFVLTSSLLAAAAFLSLSNVAAADEVYLTAEDAPGAVIPAAERFEFAEIPSTPELRDAVRNQLGRVSTTVWEPSYRVATGYRAGDPVGRAIVVEEIGKHRAITFVVGVGRDDRVSGIAVMSYREPYGGEVRSSRFLAQYQGKSGSEPLQPGVDIKNLTGATLSARAIGRGVKKALAVLDELDSGTVTPLHGEVAASR